ncbi:MAG: beta-ketoacyl-[acyl-carrier-protein] synthase family protein [Verrucomicrobiota bacterium]
MIGRNRVVITGIGVLAANGIGKDAFWQSLLAGKSGIGPITLFDASDIPDAIAGEVSGFDPRHHLDSKIKFKRMGRFTQLAIVAAKQAIEDSGLPIDYLREMAGIPVVVGSSATAMDLLAQPPAVTTAVMSLPNAPASAIAYINQLHANIHSISNGCASSLDAIAFASNLIRQGKADVAIAGGADSTITRYVFECFQKARKLPSGIDVPETACRPFDLFRTGGVIAEGAGIIILESEEHAKGRDIQPYCQIASYGTYIDPPRSMEAEGLKESMKCAIENAGIRKDNIDYISAHAPGDQEIDLTETNSIKAIFSKRSYQIPITSIKGACGSAMGTGGGHQLIATALMMKNQLVPPTTNYISKDPDCDLDYVLGNARKHKIGHALVNTHGFGRSNGSMILENMH